MHHRRQHGIRAQGRHRSLVQLTHNARAQIRRQGIAQLGFYRSTPCAGQLSGNKLRLVLQDKGIKHTRSIRLLQEISQAGTIQPQTQNGTEVIPVRGGGIAEGGAFQHRQRFFLPGIRRLYAQNLAFGIGIAAPEPGAGASRAAAGGACQNLLTIRKKAGIPGNFPFLRDAAKLLHAAHQAAFVIVLRRDEPAHRRLRIRRIRHCSPARRSDLPSNRHYRG